MLYGWIDRREEIRFAEMSKIIEIERKKIEKPKML